MSKIRTIAKINTFVVFPIFVVVYLWKDIKSAAKIWGNTLQEIAVDEGFSSFKEMAKHNYRESLAESGYTSFKDIWVQAWNNA